MSRRHFHLRQKHHLAVLQEVVTLKTDMVQDATANILELHSIPAAVSKDLAAVFPKEQSNRSSLLTEDTAGALET